MGELLFVGLGLDDERGLSRRALDLLKSSELFAEEYTSVASPGTLDRLERELGRPIRRLDRRGLEGETPILEALGRVPRVALLVVGDPFAATTHVALRLSAERAGHAFRYLPNASVLTAVPGFLGLGPYRFGPTVSLPLPAPAFAPTSPLEKIRTNRERDLHTLLLLDLNPAEGRFLTATEALAILRERDPEGRCVPEEALVAVVAQVGTDAARAAVGRFDRLRGVSFGPPPHALVVLAPRLRVEEEEALERYRVEGGPTATGSPAGSPAAPPAGSPPRRTGGS